MFWEQLAIAIDYLTACLAGVAIWRANFRKSAKSLLVWWIFWAIGGAISVIGWGWLNDQGP